MSENLAARNANYLGNAVYGALDGTVTTFAIIAGSIGANLPFQIIIILALANLFADGFSMSVGSYLSEQSKKDYLQRLEDETKQDISKDEGKSRQKITQIYQEKGFKGRDLTRALHIVTSRRSTYLFEILHHDGVIVETIKPLTISLITFISFVIVGSVPIIPILIYPQISFTGILSFVAVVLFLVGTLRSRVTHISWVRGGAEIMAAGVTASIIAYVIGDSLTKALSTLPY